MFRRTWKQIKIFVILAIVILCLPRSIFPDRIAHSAENIEDYIALNNNEKRLAEFKDSEEAIRLKLGQLEIINKSRRKHNSKPVKLDILASRLANKMCREAAENEYVGHWNLAGEKPYHRYAFAGGYDHVNENAFGEWSSDNYDATPATISEMMERGHASFMSERAPNDGHKKNIIEKEHNFVGIGFHLSGKQFRYYEEFIDRYLQFENIPSQVKKGENTSITIKTDGTYPYFLLIYFEDFPKPLSSKEISRKGSYADFTRDEYKKLFAWEMVKFKNGSSYKIPLNFSKEGLYYIQIFTDKKEITKPASMSTKGKTPYSGIVIKVTG